MNQTQHWLFVLLKEFTALQEIQKQHFVRQKKVKNIIKKIIFTKAMQGTSQVYSE